VAESPKPISPLLPRPTLLLSVQVPFWAAVSFAGVCLGVLCFGEDRGSSSPRLPLEADFVSILGRELFSRRSGSMCRGIFTVPLQYGQEQLRPASSSRTFRDFSQWGHFILEYMIATRLAPPVTPVANAMGNKKMGEK